jgi:hypothetical protein
MSLHMRSSLVGCINGINAGPEVVTVDSADLKTVIDRHSITINKMWIGINLDLDPSIKSIS